MDPIIEKSKNASRGLLYGLLVQCIFSSGELEDCPLGKLRNSLTIELKHKYVMGLDDSEVENILTQHDKCYKKRLAELTQA